MYIYIYTCVCLVGGFNHSEKIISWDDYSQYMKKNKFMIPNHQPDIVFSLVLIPFICFPEPSWTQVDGTKTAGGWSWHFVISWAIPHLSQMQPTEATCIGVKQKNAATSHFMFSATAIYFKVNKGFSQHCWYCKEATAEFDDPPLDCPKSSNFLWNIIFIFQKKNIWLVVYLPLWKIWVKWEGFFPIYGEKQKCSKPPTR